ncbi:HIT family protein [Candidatus Roizmanbacteria bacterium]|nr:HIT family protein [Candidatus Roizmanbacteria bacterium]
MFHHAPENYRCPICLGIQGIESEETLILKTDFIYRDETVSALISSFFLEHNPGHILVVPNAHYENIFDVPNEVGAQIFAVAKKMTAALKKAYECEGITLVQNNEPAGDQHALHYHLHVFPRYQNDQFFEHKTHKYLALPEERKMYGEKLLLDLGFIVKNQISKVE